MLSGMIVSCIASRKTGERIETNKSNMKSTYQKRVNDLFSEMFLKIAMLTFTMNLEVINNE